MPLTVTRKPKQSVRIGSDIEITVASVVGQQVRLTITAPQSIQILRDDIRVPVKVAK